MHCHYAPYVPVYRFWRGVLIVNTTQSDINEAVNELVREHLDSGADLNDIMNGLEDAKADAAYIAAQQALGEAA